MKQSRFSYTFFVAGLLMLATAGPASAREDRPVPGAVPSSGAESSDASGAPAGASVSEAAELRLEVERLRALVEQQDRALTELQKRVDRIGPGATGVATDEPGRAAPASAEAASPARADEDTLRKQLDELTKRWGRIRLSGDVQLRSESFFSQGFDGVELKPRNRFRVRARAQLSGEISKNFDWGIRLASGSFDNPISPQQTLGDYYTRKPFSLERAYVHFVSRTDPVDVELIGGKFEPIWKRTPFSLDPDLSPEGFAQSLRFDTGDATPLRGVKLTAWELPFRERAVGAGAVLLGGQVVTEWRWTDTLSTSLSAAFNDFEQVDVIPPALAVSPTLVNAGFEYGTTNAVVVNPSTKLPEFRSEFRVIDAIAEIKFTGIAEKWPLTITIDWLHNTSAFNRQRDGGLLIAEIGRRQDEGDLQFDYWFWKAEREAYPSVFMDSEMVIQTNAITHAVKGSYMLHKQVQFDVRYLAHRRLETLAPVNRWLHHVQFDVNYKF